MKSIKEKAEEWADMYPSCGMADKSFTEGANYVLDAIIECMPKTHSFNPNEAIDIIVNRIKELKK